MIRAGKLDRVIVIERATETIDWLGVSRMTWTPLATVRAERIDPSSTDEANRSHGTSTETTITFRIRFLDGVTVADRIAYEGQHFDIKQLKEIGRRRALELTAERKGQ